MWRRLWMVLMLLPLAVRGEGSDALPRGVDLARSMLEARQSAGFEVRMRVFEAQPYESRGSVGQLSVVGEFDLESGRLVTRRISGVGVSTSSMTGDVDRRGRVRVVLLGEGAGGEVTEGDPYAAQPYAGLFVWDMLTPWWMWAQQTVQGTDRVAGRKCVRIVSRTTAAGSPIRSVVSCVDVEHQIAMQTLLLDANDKVMRRIDVEQTTRGSSGSDRGSRVRITAMNGTAITIEPYVGDEHRVNAADTFSALRQASGALARRGDGP